MLREEIKQQLERMCEQTGQPMNEVLHHIVERYFHYEGRVIESQMSRRFPSASSETPIVEENYLYERAFGENLRKKMRELGLRDVTCEEAYIIVNFVEPFTYTIDLVEGLLHALTQRHAGWYLFERVGVQQFGCQMPLPTSDGTAILTFDHAASTFSATDNHR